MYILYNPIFFYIAHTICMGKILVLFVSKNHDLIFFPFFLKKHDLIFFCLTNQIEKVYTFYALWILLLKWTT